MTGANGDYGPPRSVAGAHSEHCPVAFCDGPSCHLVEHVGATPVRLALDAGCAWLAEEVRRAGAATNVHHFKQASQSDEEMARGDWWCAECSAEAQEVVWPCHVEHRVFGLDPWCALCRAEVAQRCG